MNGVVLFADDNIFDDGFENKLFRKFNLSGEFSVLPINNLASLETTIPSISTFRALIIDWNFKREAIDTDEDINLPDENPLDLLLKAKLFSLIYVYSQEEISEETKQELQTLYPGKIFFEKKDKVVENIDIEFEKVVSGIKKFESDNSHLQVPFVWSQAINDSVQTIFKELENADPNWVKEIYQTAESDCANPIIEIINVVNHLLNESLVQNQSLSSIISTASQTAEINVHNKLESLAKLYFRLFYTRLLDDAPIMTGDIFKFSEDEFGILITPECDINKKHTEKLDFLILSRKNSSNFICERTKKKDMNLLNNGVPSRHIIPSFPFEENIFSEPALIEFGSSFVVKENAEFQNKRASYKLNSPYIYQLRQRYLSHIGRVGVPAIPKSLQSFNLSQE